MHSDPSSRIHLAPGGATLLPAERGDLLVVVSGQVLVTPPAGWLGLGAAPQRLDAGEALPFSASGTAAVSALRRSELALVAAG